MVGKGASTKGSARAFDYILDDKGQAIELGRNLLGGTNGHELLKEMRFVQQMNKHCSNNTFSFVLSPCPDRDYSRLELKQYATDFIREMKLSKHQWIATIHNSTKIKHIHIIANRINPQTGSALNDFRIGKRTQILSQKIAEKYGLTTAKMIAERKQREQENLRAYYKKMFLQETQWSKSIFEVIDDLQSHNIHMVPMKNKKGETQGFRFMSAEEKKQYDERIYKSGRKKGEILGIKASDLGKEFSLKHMKKRGIDFTGLKLTATQQKLLNNITLGSELKINQTNLTYKRKR
ncbi:hypothetical protein EDL98_09580 [Ornithobacterium rhinotracheale]|uniref:relaxase/mobilization nuclease domain-containing protein n=1 Tax=Ornithobacterium rhinotracheale TaxID=28251 RepID=UPI00129C57F5|nr:relaxase/mobilization nuclease domain-containing protein [Ornithobacterium rhinotracheale]MRJ11318.1 hypothetical protein [Ornithobacterium rhinotracheale]